MATWQEQEAAANILFCSVGIEETTAQNAAKNPKFRKIFTEVISEAGATDGCSKTKANLLYALAGKCPENAFCHRPVVAGYIMDERIKTNAQLDGAFDYLKKVGGEPLSTASFEEAAGVGVTVTPEQIAAAAAEAIKKEEARLTEQRYHFNINVLLGAVARQLKWADGAAIRAELEQQVEAILGPKTEDDLKPLDKKALKKDKKAPAKAEDAPVAANGAGSSSNGAVAAGAPAPVENAEEAGPPADPFSMMPDPGDNNMVHTKVHFSDGRIMMISNTPEQLRTHLAGTGGRVMTRFPPEPNGYLHLGHAKAMFIDFGYAEARDGLCFLRYDDTNPEAEKLEYIEHIQEIIGWMGWKPWKITYSSDYFEELYNLAVELIKRGHAYVDHQSKEEIEAYRKDKLPSPWRDRPIEESLALFNDMRRGLVAEGAATLRMRMDHANDNYNMFDLIAYRIKFTAHPHAGARWCIYPSYDYTHCLVDSLENISHSLCTLEFESRRASYYWLLEVLDLYKPYVWEYGRLNITNNVMSKRKLNLLVTKNYVKGWDDPRLLTLAGLRRRGVTPAAINAFCREVGVSRNETIIPMHRFEHFIRTDLDGTSARTLAVRKPLKVVIQNLPESHLEEVEAKHFPGRSDAGYSVPFTRVVYVEEMDFREVDEKGYYGLAPGKTALLRYAYPITITGLSKDAAGKVVELQADYDPDYKTKKPPKGVLNWVAQPQPGVEPTRVTLREYDYLFTLEDPAELADNWLDAFNHDSLTVIDGAFANPQLATAKVGDRFQFERLGYFCVDADSTPGNLVFNRTVTLKDSAFTKLVGKQ